MRSAMTAVTSAGLSVRLTDKSINVSRTYPLVQSKNFAFLPPDNCSARRSDRRRGARAAARAAVGSVGAVVDCTPRTRPQQCSCGRELGGAAANAPRCYGGQLRAATGIGGGSPLWPSPQHCRRRARCVHDICDNDSPSCLIRGGKQRLQSRRRRGSTPSPAPA